MVCFDPVVMFVPVDGGVGGLDPMVLRGQGDGSVGDVDPAVLRCVGKKRIGRWGLGGSLEGEGRR